MLGEFVGEDMRYNGERIGLSGYCEMLGRDSRELPTLRFGFRSSFAPTAVAAHAFDERVDVASSTSANINSQPGDDRAACAQAQRWQPKDGRNS